MLVRNATLNHKINRSNTVVDVEERRDLLVIHIRYLFLLAVRTLGLAHGLDSSLEASLELKSLLGSTSLLLLLLLLGDLRGLTLDLTGLCQRTVNLSHGLLKQ